ncbi:MAG: dihydropyrimidinase [Ruthenibacterium sp.]
MGTILTNGTLVTAQGEQKADMLLENGKIAQIDAQIPQAGHIVYDAAGCYVFPGMIDAHTHLDMSTATATTADNFDTGTAAALAGGTTTLIDFATQEKTETLHTALQNWHKKADGNSHCDYAFHMAITDWNADVCREIGELKALGVTSFKLYLAYDALRVTDAQLYEVLVAVGKAHGIVGVHCENGDLVDELTAKLKRAGEFGVSAHPKSRPDYVEAEAISRYCYVAKAANVPVHIVHVSTKLGLAEALKARARGQKVYIETCPQYLALDDEKYLLPDFEGAKYVCSPPLRGKDDVAALWQSVQNGEVDSISTDHCSFRFDTQKSMGKDDFSQIPNGMPGIEHRLSVLYTDGVAAGHITRSRLAALLSENAARLFGLYPQKGTLAIGSDADIVVWNPAAEWTITAEKMLQNVDYTPYEGKKISGIAKAVFLHGELAAENGAVIKRNLGRYVPRGESEYF